MLDKTDPETLAALDKAGEAQAVAVSAETEEVGDTFEIPITKAGRTLTVTTKGMSNNVYRMALILGLKDLCNRGMTKITVTENRKKMEGEKLIAAQNAAFDKAEENLALLMKGKLPRMVGVKSESDKLSGVVMTEARRLAKNLIKDEIKAAGEKISHYESKDITAAANAVLKNDDEVSKKLIAQAKENVAKREQNVEEKKSSTGVSKEKLQALGLNVSQKKVAEAEKAKKDKAEKGKTLLSAATAGQVGVRQRTQPAKG